METARFVQRARAVADERQVIVSLTARGRKLREKALGMPAKVLCAADYSPGEVATMIRKLGTLRQNLGNNSGRSPTRWPVRGALMARAGRAVDGREAGGPGSSGPVHIDRK